MRSYLLILVIAVLVYAVLGRSIPSYDDDESDDVQQEANLRNRDEQALLIQLKQLVDSNEEVIDDQPMETDSDSNENDDDDRDKRQLDEQDDEEGSDNEEDDEIQPEPQYKELFDNPDEIADETTISMVIENDDEQTNESDNESQSNEEEENTD